METSREIKISKPTPPQGFLHRRFKSLPLGVYNKRGKLVLWVGGKYLPANGPAVWVMMALALIAGFIGGKL